MAPTKLRRVDPSAPGDIVAEAAHICVDFGSERVLDEVALQIRAGDFLGVIGPNGSGKTTLLRVLLGLIRPACGHVRLFGTEIRAFREWRRVGYVPQKAVFESRFPASVFEVVASGRSGVSGLGRRLGSTDRRAVGEALATVGLGDARDRLIGALSQGQQQRVLIARALVHSPELLLLDEPTVGVDPEAQDQFYALLRYLNRELHTTLVLVSHDVSVIANEVTELACLNRTLVFHGDPEEAVRSGALERLYRPDSLVVSHHH